MYQKNTYIIIKAASFNSENGALQVNSAIVQCAEKQL